MSAKSRRYLVGMLGTIGLAMLGLPAAAQIAPSDKQFILRTYEVGDLLIEVSDHAYPHGDAGLGTRRTTSMAFGGGRGGGGGYGMSNTGEGTPAQSSGGRTAPRSATRVTMDDLVHVIRATVHPDSWDLSGQTGRIESVGPALVVWQSPAVHQQIEQLLIQLGQASQERRTLAIDARWLTLDSDDVDRLLDEENRVVEERLEEFTRRPTTIRGKTNCFSGQLVYLVSGTKQNVVSGYVPVVGQHAAPDRGEHALTARRQQSPFRLVQHSRGEGGGRSVGYQPLVERPNLGALLEIRPTMSRGTETAVVDLKSTLTSTSGDLHAQASHDASAFAPTVDRMAYHVQEVATTLRLRLGEPALVGGLTFVPQAGVDGVVGEDEASGRGGRPQVYLVLALHEGR